MFDDARIGMKDLQNRNRIAQVSDHEMINNFYKIYWSFGVIRTKDV